MLLPTRFSSMILRMKKIIFIAFLTFSINCATAWVDNCAQFNDSEQSCRDNHCIYTTLGCIPCANGQYAKDNKCESCTNIPNGATATGPGTAADNCPWTISCNEKHKVDGKLGCVPCAGNEWAPATTIRFDGENYWNGDFPDDPLTPETSEYTYCTPVPVKIILKRNRGDNTQKEWWAYCMNGFSYTNDPSGSDGWKQDPGADSIPENPNWSKKFTGYFTEATGGTKYFNVLGRREAGINACTFTTPETTLYAQWEPASYTVEYYYKEDDNSTYMLQTCTIDQSCPVREPNKTDLPADKGKYFDFWYCFEGCDHIDDDSQKKLSLTDDIDTKIMSNFPDKDKDLASPPKLKLIAIIGDCPKGYYCDDNGPHPCPLGATTDGAGKESIKDCIMVPGTGGTKFCTDNGTNCFTLPSNKNLHYNPPTATAVR